jgi:hypothetical protein
MSGLTVKFDGKTYALLKGQQKANCPKSYGQRVALVRRKRFSIDESGLVSLFRVNRGLRYETYCDGAIYPYYGMLREVE